jgi:hypothetical protein
MTGKTANRKASPDSASSCQGLLPPEVFIVNRESVLATRRKLDDPDKLAEAIRDVRKMLEIKDTLLWRTEMSPCCGSLTSLSSCLACEVDLLQRTLRALEDGDKEQAARLLDEYAHLLEVNREPPEPEYR